MSGRGSSRWRGVVRSPSSATSRAGGRAPAPARRGPGADRRGLTLVQLVVAIVALGVALALVIPRLAGPAPQADVARLEAALRALAAAQESHYYQRGAYAATLAALGPAALGPAAPPTSPEVAVTVVEATAGGWSARAVQPTAPATTCAIYYGAARPIPPATAPGAPSCR